MRSSARSLAALVLLLVLAGLGWWLQAEDAPGRDDASSATATGASTPVEDPDSGLPVVRLDDLPPEAAGTIALIEADGPFPYDQDDGTFGNFEGLLPERERGYYREYTVETPGSEDRGARRIVGGAAGELYWTEDHYASFALIER